MSGTYAGPPAPVIPFISRQASRAWLSGGSLPGNWAAEAVSSAAPWYGVRHGKDAVADFFAGFGSIMEVEQFTPVSFAANDTGVLTVVPFPALSRSTGRAAQMNLHHYFRFRDGKIAYYRGSEDTAQTETVLQG